MNFLKASLLNAGAVLVKLVSAVAINKLFSAYVGPAGYSVVGQFQNFLMVVSSLCGGLISTGVTQKVAENVGNTEKQEQIYRVALKSALLVMLAVAVFICIAWHPISRFLSNSVSLGYVLAGTVACLPGVTMNNVQLGVMGGRRDYVSAFLMATCSSLGALFAACLLTPTYGLPGALMAIVLGPAVTGMAFFAIRMPQSAYKPTITELREPIHRPVLKELRGFALSGMVSALAMPLALMVIRGNVTATAGATAAGYWQASWKISELYILVITATLSGYYLPKVAGIKYQRALLNELKRVSSVALPAVILSALVIYYFRDALIGAMFNKAFLPMRDLFAWQLPGDIMKVASWLFAYIILGRAANRIYVIAEVAFTSVFIFLCILFVNRFGIIGAPISYTLSYAGYCLMMGWLAYRQYRAMPVDM